MKRGIIIFALALGCVSPTAPEYVDRTPFDPPAWYAIAHADMLHCLDRTGPPYSEVRWYVAGEINGGENGGWWDGMTITLLETATEDARLVTHELIHLISQEEHSDPWTLNWHMWERCEWERWMRAPKA